MLDRDELEFLALEIISGEVVVSPRARAWLASYDENALIEILWQVGFLTAQVIGGLRGGPRGGSSCLGHHQAANLTLRNVQRFGIHPMFRAYLGTR